MKNSRLIVVLAVTIYLCTASTTLLSAQDQNTSTGSDITATTQDVNEIVGHYIALKEALIQSNSKAASNAASELVEFLAIPASTSILYTIKADAVYIVETNDLDEQRKHFGTMSETVYSLVKATGANEDTLYWQYCPMALDHQGAYWISLEKKINNPYFGEKMLHCGSVKDEF